MLNACECAEGILFSVQVCSYHDVNYRNNGIDAAEKLMTKSILQQGS